MIEWWGALLAAVAGGGVKWLIDRRHTSGQVTTSDAKTLWEQAEELRNELRTQRRECHREVETLEIEVFRLRIENHSLRNDLLKLQFGAHPDIPEALRETLLKRQEDHVQALQSSFADLQRRYDESGRADR